MPRQPSGNRNDEKPVVHHRSLLCIVLVASAIAVAQRGRTARTRTTNLRPIRSSRRARLGSRSAVQERRLHVRAHHYDSWGRGWGLDHRLSRQRPELLLPPAAAHVAEGRPQVPRFCELTDDELFDYPFIYMIEPGELDVLRRRGRRPPPLPAQRRLPDGGRLLGRGRVGQLLPRDQARLSPTASRTSCRWTTRSFTASTT